MKAKNTDMKVCSLNEEEHGNKLWKGDTALKWRRVKKVLNDKVGSQWLCMVQSEED